MIPERPVQIDEPRHQFPMGEAILSRNKTDCSMSKQFVHDISKFPREKDHTPPPQFGFGLNRPARANVPVSHDRPVGPALSGDVPGHEPHPSPTNNVNSDHIDSSSLPTRLSRTPQKAPSISHTSASHYFREIGGHPILPPQHQSALATDIAEYSRERNRLWCQLPLGIRHLLYFMREIEAERLPVSSLIEGRPTKPTLDHDEPSEDPARSSIRKEIVHRLSGLLEEYLRIRQARFRGWPSTSIHPLQTDRLGQLEAAIQEHLESIIFHPQFFDSLFASLSTAEYLIAFSTRSSRTPPVSRASLLAYLQSGSCLFLHLPSAQLLASLLARNITPSLNFLEQEFLHMPAQSFLAVSQTFRHLTEKIQEAKEQLILGNLRLVISIAKGFRRYHTPFSDLIQEGNLALMKAVEKFDFQRGVRFTSYATWWIWKAIGRMVRERNRVIHVPNQAVVNSRRLDRQVEILKQRLGRLPTIEELSEHCRVSIEKIDFLLDLPLNGLSLEDWGSDNPDYLNTQGILFLPAVLSPFKETFLAEQKIIISEALRQLPELEADILRKRYGLEGYEEQTISEISERYQLPRERIRQLETRGLRRLAQYRVFWEMGN